MPKGIYDRSKSKWKPWNKGIPRCQKVKDAISKANKGRLKGSENPNWKGGIYTDSQGYIFIFSPNHPFRDCRNYVKRSHLVMEKILGRYLQPTEQIHHKGIKYPINSVENKQDDRIENLQLFVNASEHTKFHNSFNKHKFISSSQKL